MEVLYNIKYGGFSFSLTLLKQLYLRYPELFRVAEMVTTHISEDEFYKLDEDRDFRDNQGIIRHLTDDCWSRTDPKLLEVVKQVGLKESSGRFCDLRIETIPLGCDYEIHEYDGRERIEIKLPYVAIIEDLKSFYLTGCKEWKCMLTQKVLDGEIKLN